VMPLPSAGATDGAASTPQDKASSPDTKPAASASSSGG